MKKIALSILLTSISFAFEIPDLHIPQNIKNIGKKTPIDIALYVKNSSTKCTLRVKNITNPYKKDITKEKLPILQISAGRYYRKNISNILKGTYDFEYTWLKGKKFIDSGVKSIQIYAYHDTNLAINKKVNLLFENLMPKECR